MNEESSRDDTIRSANEIRLAQPAGDRDRVRHPRACECRGKDAEHPDEPAPPCGACVRYCSASSSAGGAISAGDAAAGTTETSIAGAREASYRSRSFKVFPGRIYDGRVETVLQAIATGQTQVGGRAVAPEQIQAAPFVVRVKRDDAEVTRRLPAGSTGTAAIYTEHVKAAHVIRQVVLRQVAIPQLRQPVLRWEHEGAEP